ncbi:MAG: adenosine deaminase [Myxococcales bacterium]|nr:adenosine deaminase [Myxococcales bacterium]MCB9646161.1 adenosine deaminase [Deltaproteobacteria bacterium]
MPVDVPVPSLRTPERPPIPGLPDELVELHLHVGGAVAPHILWAMAHEQGFKLPTKDFFEFVDIVSSNPDKVKSLEDYLRILHEWTEKIQSSPHAIERAIYEIFAKEFRGAKVHTMELRFNPMKRNLGGERDLDHIIHAALRGLDRACLEYGITGGLIFCLAREFDADLNEIIVEKAIRYRARGVVGIDLAGTEKNNLELQPATVERFAGLFAMAREAGLKTTCHTGETPHTDASGVIAAVRRLKVDRIGHGIRAAYSDEAMKILREEDVVLEICPTSNLHTRAVSGMDELAHVLRTLRTNGVKFTINTDATYMLGTDLRREVELLTTSGILSAEDVAWCFQNAKDALFVESR